MNMASIEKVIYVICIFISIHMLVEVQLKWKIYRHFCTLENLKIIPLAVYGSSNLHKSLADHEYQSMIRVPKLHFLGEIKYILDNSYDKLTTYVIYCL